MHKIIIKLKMDSSLIWSIEIYRSSLKKSFLLLGIYYERF